MDYSRWRLRRCQHRGGGEYGPSWHQAALKEKRHRAYEDFAAVAKDLFERKVTRPQKLGIQGGSNGGLLVGNMMTLYPELFQAVVCKCHCSTCSAITNCLLVLLGWQSTETQISRNNVLHSHVFALPQCGRE